MCVHPRVVAESNRVPEHDRDLGDEARGGAPGERGDVSVFRRGRRGRAGFSIWIRSRPGGRNGGDVIQRHHVPGRRRLHPPQQAVEDQVRILLRVEGEVFTGGGD